MPPASSTSGGAHGVLPHAMSPVCESKFDLCGSADQSTPTFSLRHAAVTPCLQNRPRLSGTSLTWGCGRERIYWDRVLSDPLVVRLGGQAGRRSWRSCDPARG